MSAVAIIGQVRSCGGQITVNSADLVLTAPQPLPDDLLAEIKLHKPGIVAVLAQPNLSSEDSIYIEEVQAPETAAVAREREALKEYFLERVAILEAAGVDDAVLEAAKLTATFARNARFLWTALRSAFEGQPDLVAQLPEERGVVDALPLGPPSVVVRRDGTVVRQGAFSGAQEVRI